MKEIICKKCKKNEIEVISHVNVSISGVHSTFYSLNCSNCGAEIEVDEEEKLRIVQADLFRRIRG